MTRKDGQAMRTRAWLSTAMHAGFFLLLAASAARLLVRHGLHGPTTVTALVLAAALGGVYGLGIAVAGTPSPLATAWLATVCGLWLILVLLSPSFGWCAVPLFFLCLRLLRPPVTAGAAVVLTGAVIIGQVRIAEVFDPSLILAPIGIAAMTTVVFWTLDREVAVRQQLIDDLVTTQDTLAQSQRRTGILAERQRLAREIHDTLAQGLSSMGILLQAAERSWGDPDTAKSYVMRAEAVAADNLAEARRFVHDLRPAALEAHSLAEALAALCEHLGLDGGPAIQFRLDGTEREVPETVQAVLLRVAQAALGNVVEHAAAATATITLSFLDEEVSLDIVDDGTGFTSPAAAAGRGFGLTAMRQRMAGIGGRLDVESTPGEGTAIAARVGLREGETR